MIGSGIYLGATEKGHVLIKAFQNLILESHILLANTAQIHSEQLLVCRHGQETVINVFFT